MDGDELQSRFLVSVVDPTKCWSLVSEMLLNRLPFHHVHLKNKFSKLIKVNELQIQYISSDDPLLKRRKAFAHQPVTWFRNPYAQLVLVSGESVDEYKQHVRDGLRRLLDPPGDAVGGPAESIVVYVKPSSVDAFSKGPGKVYQALRSDFSSRRKDRCIRVDFSGGVVSGMDDLERMLRDAIKSTFEARATAYDEQVRQLMDRRQSPGWQFSTLFLVKDSLAVMLESAHLYEDALREYSELEACYLEALAAGGQLSQQPFGGNGPNDDVAQLLSATWRETRHAVLETGMVPQFQFRQFLFACQARILVKLNRHIEVAERGLKFVGALGELLTEAGLPQNFREAWAFSACLALAVQLAHTAPVSSAGMQPALMPTTSDASNQHSSAKTAAERTGRPIARSQSAGDLGDSPEPSPRHGSASPSKRSTTSTGALSNDDGDAGLRQTAARAQRTITMPQRPSRLDPSSERGSTTNHGGGQTNGPGRAEQQQLLQPPKRPRTDWGLGLSVAYDAELREEAGQYAAAGVSRAPSGLLDPAGRAFWCALGNLYAAARTDLMRLGHAAVLRPDVSESPMLQNGVSPLGVPQGSPDGSPMRARTEAVQQLDQTVQESRPSGDLASRLSRFAPFEAAIGFRDRRLRGRSDAADSVRSLALANNHNKSFTQLQADSASASSETPVHSELGDATDALPISSAAKTDFLSYPATNMDKASIRSRSHGEDVSKLVDQSSEAALSEERRKSETDLAASQGLPPVKSTINTNDLRYVEREVETSSESSMPTTPVLGNGKRHNSAVPEGGRRFAWLTEKRLVSALSAKQDYEELWLELSRCAAMCYKRGGRRRNAALLRSEVAEALASRGAVRASVSLLAALAQDALLEGWLSLAAGLLFRLLEVSRPLVAADKAPVCVRLLSLSDAMGPSSEQKAVQDELMQAATALSRAAPLPGPLPDLKLQNGHLDALRMLWVQPVQGEYARFFGQSSSPGEPVLAMSRRCSEQPPAEDQSHMDIDAPKQPSAPATSDAGNASSAASGTRTRPGAEGTPGQQRADGGGGEIPLQGQLPSAALHFEGCLGDVLCVHLDLVSILPQAVPLQQITLVIAIMQETSTPSSVATSPTGTTKSGSPFETALDTRATLEHRLRSTPRMYRAFSEPGSPPSGQRTAVVWQEVEEVECPVASSQGGERSVVLQPGQTRLSFQVTVMKQGVFTLKHVQARLGRLSLRLRSALPDEEGPPVELLSAGSTTLASSDAQTLAQQPPIGEIDALGRPREVAVLLNAHACQPRLRLTAAAHKGRLIAGHLNWLGLALQPLHDELLDLRIHAAPAPPATADPWASSASTPSYQRDSRSTRQAGSMVGSKTWTLLDSLELLDHDAVLMPFDPLSGSASAVQSSQHADNNSESASSAPEPRGEQMRIVARISSGVSDHREGDWVSMQPTRGPSSLPRWTARQASILWLCVRPDSEDLEVLKREMHHLKQVLGVLEAPPEVVHLVGHAEGRAWQQSVESAQQSLAVELDVNVEYNAGCHRSHAARIAVPVTGPLRVSMVAKELPDRRVLLQARVTSMLSRPASITRATLSAPAGYEVQELPQELQFLYPLQVLPERTVAVLMYMAPHHKASRSARSVPSSLKLDFTVLESVAAAGPVEEISNSQSMPAVSLPGPPPSPAQATKGGEQDSAQCYSLAHKFVLEATEVAETPRTSVTLQLLGPHTVKVGEQATLCWRLERIGAADAGLLIACDAFADAEAWSPAGVRSSYVSLSAGPGSVATMEAAWTPLIVGDLSVPQLRLRDVGQKDILDDAALSFITCLPAG